MPVNLSNEPIEQPSEFVERVHESLLKFQAKSFDMATAYTKVLLGLGYGGFFTVWSFMKGHMGKRESILAAMLITTSLVVFIAYEVWGLFLLNVLNLRNANKLLKARTLDELTDKALAIETSETRRRKLLIKVWMPVFIVCVATGLLGACVMISRFLLELLK